MVVELRQALPLSRQQAADKKIWHWLGIIHAPDFVAWRWRPSGAESTRSPARFTGDRVRQTYAKLWWVAELTREGDDDALTNQLFALPGFQDVYEAIFGRAIANYRPAVEAFLVTVAGRSEHFIREFSRQLGYIFPLSLLETMSEEELVPFMKQLAADMDS